MKTKYCPSCEKDRPVSDFWKHKNRIDGLQSTCKECHYYKYNVNKDKIKARAATKRCENSLKGKIRVKAYRKSKRGKESQKRGQLKYRLSGKAKNRQLKKLYNLSLDEYMEICKKQNGVCYICGRPSDGQALCVDHNHKTGVVRGLLCNGCNLRLGWYEKNREVINEYLN